MRSMSSVSAKIDFIVDGPARAMRKTVLLFYREDVNSAMRSSRPRKKLGETSALRPAGMTIGAYIGGWCILRAGPK